VTKGTVYLCFPSKADLFKAVIRETVLPNLNLIEAAASALGSAQVRLCVALQI
jgi:AcrR family transcriptional regulator